MRLIDADALMKVIREHDYPLRSHFNSTDNGMFTIGVQQAVDDAPTIDAVSVVRCGEWVEAKSGVMSVWPPGQVMCSVCGQRMPSQWKKMPPYCYGCGAKMEVEP
jgi:hypothetical protein